VYFFLATTESQKLLDTIKTRCTKVSLKGIEDAHMKVMLVDVCKKAGKKVPQSVLDKIVEVSFGSAREALVYLHSVMELESEKEMLNAILPEEVQKSGIEIARALHNKNTTWKQMADILKSVNLSEHEGLRRMIMSYASKCLLSAGPIAPRAFLVLDSFRDNFFGSEQNGLVAACYEVICGG
jgi:DNA polymerase III delta prime subunit